MKRNAKIIQISGFRGLMLFMFTIVCLIAGFAVFPGLCAMYIWNHIAGTYAIAPQINLIQGILLWAFAALTIYMTSGRKIFVSFKKQDELEDDEINDIMEKIKSESKAKMMNSMILSADDLQKIKEIKEKNLSGTEQVQSKEKEEVITSSKENL